VSLIGQAIGDALARGLAPTLLAQGYQKRGRVWWRREADALAMVIVEVEKNVQTNTGRFTFDLGVHFIEVARLLGAPRVEVGPRPVDAGLRLNIARAAGQTGPPDAVVVADGTGSSVIWWWQPTTATTPETIPATPPADLTPIVSSVENAWRRFAEPWLARYRELPTALEALIDQKQWWIAAAAAMALGDRVQAQYLARQGLTHAHPLRQRAIEDWATHHGLGVQR
jgi:hypothetical protein